MTDLVCNFSCCRSLTTNCYLPLFLPPKRYHSSALHSHNTRIIRIKRSSSRLILLFKPSPFAASASDIDVISTHESSDGSFLFRFGDPSEIQKNVEMEEPKTIVEEIEGGDRNGPSVVKLKEGDDEAEVIASGLTEASDHSDSTVINRNIAIAVEGENEYPEKLLEDDTELPVLTSNKEMEGVSIPDISIKLVDNVEDINEEYYTSLVGASIPDERSKIENSIATLEVSSDESLKETSNVTSTSKETEITLVPGVDVGQLTVNAESLDQEDDASIHDQSYELVDDVTTVALSSKDSDDITPSDVDTDQSGSLNEDHDDEVSAVEASVIDKISEVLNGISTAALLGKETNDISSASEIEKEPTGDLEEGLDEEYEDSPVDTSMLDSRSEVLNIVTAETSIEEEIANTISSADTEIELTENLEESKNEVYEDSRSDTSVLDNSSDVLNIITTEAASENETYGITSTSDIEIEQTGNMEEGINEEHEDSPGDTAVLDKRSEILNIITTGESSENETADITSAPDINIEHTVKVEQGLDQVLEEGCSVDASTPNKWPEVENNIAEQDILAKETADATTLVDFNADLVVAVLDTDTYQGRLETAYTTDGAPISEYQNEKTVIRDESIGDGGESFGNNLVSSSPQLEPAICLNEETEKPILQSELQTLAIEESSETDVNNIKAIEMQNVVSNKCAETESPTMEPAMTWSVRLEEQAFGSGSGILNETVGYASEEDMIQSFSVPPQLDGDSMLEEETGTETVEELRDDDASENQTVGRDLVEASVDEVIIPESTEPTITSQEMLKTDFDLFSGAALLPHPSKVLTGGEDAYFIAGQKWLGLADGVSQWSLEGTTEGVYAQELIKNCEKLVSDCNSNSINNPLDLLNISVARTHSPGSATVLIAQFDGQAMHVANVGDSGFLVLRHGAVYKRCSPMHHVFSLPVLIERGDDPSCIAQLYRVDIEEEDLIVLATDGLLDNLYDQEISLIAMKSHADHKSPEEIAALLAKRAHEVGCSTSARTPFADDAQAAGFPGYSGGKLDDVAVIVSIVQRRR